MSSIMPILTANVVFWLAVLLFAAIYSVLSLGCMLLAEYLANRYVTARSKVAGWIFMGLHILLRFAAVPGYHVIHLMGARFKVIYMTLDELKEAHEKEYEAYQDRMAELEKEIMARYEEEE